MNEAVKQSADITTESHHENLLTAAKGGGLTFIGQFTQYGVSFVFSFLMARLLGADQYGLYRLVLTVSFVVAAFARLGLNGGIAHFIPSARSKNDDKKIWGIIQVGLGIPLILSLLASIFLIVFAEQVAVQIFHKPSMTPILRIATLAIPIIAFSQGMAAIAQGFKKVEYIAYSHQIVFNVLKLVLSVIAIFIGMGVMGVTLSYVVSWIVAFGLMIYFVNKLFPLWHPPKKIRRPFKEMFHFSLPLYLSRLLNRFGNDFETLILGYFGMLVDVGVYSIVLRLGDIGTMLFGSLTKISVPIISELHSQKRMNELKRYYQTLTNWSLLFNLPIFFSIFLFAKGMLAVFGKDFTVGSTALILLSLGLLFSISMGISGTLINMTGHTKLGFVNSLVYFGTTLALDFILIPRYKLLGAALAGGLTHVIINVLRFSEVFFMFNGLQPFNSKSLKPVAAILLASFITYFLIINFFVKTPLLQFLFFTPVLWGLYIGAVLLMGLSDEDKMVIGKVFKKMFRKN